MKYTVYLYTTEEIGVNIEADDPDEAVDRAYEQMPGSVCASCAGWGQNWFRNAEGHEAETVTDENGDTAWEQNSPLDDARAQIDQQAAEIKRLKDQLGGAR